jgi:NAD(P)H-nitrite reductase large subunit
MAKIQIVLVGNSLTGIRCVEEIVKIHPNKFDITLLRIEPHLSQILVQKTLLHYWTLSNRIWYKKNNIQLFTRGSVIKIDPDMQMVYTDKNHQVHYDRLILATDSIPIILPISGATTYRMLGMKPNIQLAEESGIPVNHGIIVNDFMETGIPNIYAVGECAEHRTVVYKVIALLHEQAKVLANRICGMVSNPFQGEEQLGKVNSYWR